MTQITNYDHCLRFQVLDKRITLIDSDTAEVVADNRGNICIHIEFDDQWDGCDKTARFIYNGNWKDVVLNVDNECICPSEVVKKGRFSLGVYGAKLKTTTPIAISVAASILSESGEELPDDPTPGQYEQIMKLYVEATTAADEATKAAWGAVGAADNAIQALHSAKEELEQGGFITSIEEKNKGVYLSFWVGAQDEYDALDNKTNNCLYIITDDIMADYIVEQGTSGIWNYRKWASGIAEAWGYTAQKEMKSEDWEKTETVYHLKNALSEQLPANVFASGNTINSYVQAVGFHGTYPTSESQASKEYDKVYWNVVRHWTDGETYYVVFNIDLKGRWK